MSARILVQKELDKLEKSIEYATLKLREIELEATSIRSQIEKMNEAREQFLSDLEKLNG